jgi:hypothetical protein
VAGVDRSALRRLGDGARGGSAEPGARLGGERTTPSTSNRTSGSSTTPVHILVTADVGPLSRCSTVGDQSAAVGEHDGLGPVVHVDLGQYPS